MPPKLILATNNLHKVREIEPILAGAPVEIFSVREFPELASMEVEETGSTFEENAVTKARAVADRFGMAALADDSGLEVEGLDGGPGVQSSRYLGKETPYELKNQRILELLREVHLRVLCSWSKSERSRRIRSARFVCVAALAFPDGRIVTFRGECSGEIAEEPRGRGGFGYDPIFRLPELGRTMAELSPEEKNRISHRARAFVQVREFLINAG